jgi:hypothetical protein
MLKLYLYGLPQQDSGDVAVLEFKLRELLYTIKMYGGKNAVSQDGRHGKVLEVHENTITSWMGMHHCKTKPVKLVSTEMRLHVLAYKVTRKINTMGVKPLIAAIEASQASLS